MAAGQCRDNTSKRQAITASNWLSEVRALSEVVPVLLLPLELKVAENGSAMLII
ncbi:hypothetical protein MGG_17954 [Pyricularia oryzae 70-15]|uniref:Uncharacterized protein n=1 Tax=Pyricularia oryzae (strain 70-15 / ATCC MYA-4617 / FGSC 8958) TaxID=242507 RepID=G4NLW0_PYRO7|nr:uncharacterized protein MGG_17954 [Pyricularia oryzae 70-15]EHA46163.1 hypothetical protein MGG_17954 [Pyricularia oryzae 70-15]